MTRQTTAPLRPWTQADFRRERIGVVYALVDPRDRQIRYIGYTSLSPQERLNQHMKQARHLRGKTSYHAINWLNALADQELRPEIFPLDSFVADRWQERERHWIRVYRQLGCDLTNTQPGGGGRKSGASPLRGKRLSGTHRAKISEATRQRYADPAQRRKTAAALTGKVVSEATRDKIRKHATHCPAGHEFTEENTVCYRPGVKECRTCRREKGRAAQRRRVAKFKANGLTSEGKPWRRGVWCRKGLHELVGDNRLSGVDGKCRACREGK